MAASTAQRRKTLSHPRRGDIYLVSFDPTIGHEITKTRPALVIQNDIANEYSPITIVAAVTSQFGDPPYPTEVVMGSAQSGLPQRSAVLLNQIRSVDRQCLIRRLGRADPDTMQRVDQAIQTSLGLISF